MNARADGSPPAVPEPPASAPPRSRWEIVALLILAGIAAAMMFAKVSVIFFDVRDAFATDDVVAGLAMSLPALTAIVLGVSAGVLVGELGARRVLLASLIAGAVLSLVQAIAMPVWLFLVLRVLEGAAHLGIVVAAPVIIIAVTAPRQRTLAMALWSTFFGLGFALAGLVAPAVSDVGGPALVFAAHGLLLLAIAAAAAFVVRPGIIAVVRGAGVTAARFLREHVDAYRNPRSALPATVFIWHTFMYTAILAIVPVYADAADEALLLVGMPLISIAGTLATGPLVRYASPALVLAGGYVLVGASILGLWAAIAADGPIVAAAMTLMFCSGIVQGGSFALIPALSGDPGVNARANGALTQVGNIGSLVGPPVFAWIAVSSAPSFGPFAIVVAIACGGGIAAALLTWRWIRRRLRREA